MLTCPEKGVAIVRPTSNQFKGLTLTKKKQGREKNEGMGQKQPKRILFYLYDSSDDSDQILQKELARALRQLVRDEYLDEWSDQQIQAGTNVAETRTQALEYGGTSCQDNFQPK